MPAGASGRMIASDSHNRPSSTPPTASATEPIGFELKPSSRSTMTSTGSAVTAMQRPKAMA
jgi:hypothetical protein